jgi:hypothetical protein
MVDETMKLQKIAKFTEVQRGLVRRLFERLAHNRGPRPGDVMTAARFGGTTKEKIARVTPPQDFPEACATSR